VKSQSVYQFTGDEAGFVALKAEAHGAEIELSEVAPFSITVIDIRL